MKHKHELSIKEITHLQKDVKRLENINEHIDDTNQQLNNTLKLFNKNKYCVTKTYKFMDKSNRNTQ